MSAAVNRGNGPREKYSPHRLWSLWEMIDNYAHTFAFLCGALEYLESRLQQEQRALIPHDDWCCKIGRDYMEIAKPMLGAVGMTAVIPEIQRIERSLDIAPQSVIGTDSLKHAIKHLNNRIKDDLKEIKFLYVSPTNRDLYESKNLFGDIVTAKFAKAAEDIENAGKCLALGQTTASVFHLMRVMEYGVQLLGKRFKVKINVRTETWYQIQVHVDNAISALPNKTPHQKARKAKYASASALLSNVRIAWRNDVMHPKATYQSEEAREVFNAVKGFMRHLAEVV